MTDHDAFDVARNALVLLAPEFLIVLAAVALMTAGAFVRLPRRTWWMISTVILGLAGLLLAAIGPFPTESYGSVVVGDALGFGARMVIVLTGLAFLALAHDQVDDSRAPEFFGALLLAHAGAMTVACSNDLVLLFVGLELVSIPTYLMLYLPRRTARTQEATTKYFYLSIFSSGLLLYGLAFLYGQAGISNLKALSYVMHFLPGMPQDQFGLIAVVFILAGLGFRVAAVPFHFYAPDVYQGAPTVVTGLLAWLPKAVGFLALLRVLTAVLGGSSLLSGQAQTLIWAIAVGTILLGNILALVQENLKRLIAYSSIAHAGYLMIGIMAAMEHGTRVRGLILGSEGILIYLVTYALMTLGVFAALLLLPSLGEKAETVSDLSGLARRRPFIAAALALSLLSLAGIPPTAGFWGKFQVFASAVSAAQRSGNGMFVSVVFVGVLGAAMGAYYYLRPVVLMYVRNPREPQPAPIASTGAEAPWPTVVVLAVSTALTVALFVVPGPLFRAGRTAAIEAVSLPETTTVKTVASSPSGPSPATIVTPLPKAIPTRAPNP